MIQRLLLYHVQIMVSDYSDPNSLKDKINQVIMTLTVFLKALHLFWFSYNNERASESLNS